MITIIAFFLCAYGDDGGGIYLIERYIYIQYYFFRILFVLWVELSFSCLFMPLGLFADSLLFLVAVLDLFCDDAVVCM
jgi:hypothetical protein